MQTEFLLLILVMIGLEAGWVPEGQAPLFSPPFSLVADRGASHAALMSRTLHWILYGNEIRLVDKLAWSRSS